MSSEVDDLRAQVEALTQALTEAERRIHRDAEERTRSVEALRRMDERLRTVLSNAPLILLACDRDGIATLYEGKGVEALGRRPGELVGRSLYDQFGDLPGAREAIDRVLAGEEVRWEHDFRGAWFEVVLVPVRDAAGAVVGANGVAMDFTDRKRAESALQVSEARFRSMVEKSSETIAMIAADGTVLYSSPAVRTFLGVSPADVVGTSVLLPVVPEDRERVAAALTALVEAPRPEPTEEGDDAIARTDIELRVRDRAGGTRWLECTLSNMLHDPAVEAVVLNARDATERRRHDDARNRLAAIVESSHDAIMSVDLAGVVQTWNRAAEQLYGYSAEEMIGRSIEAIVPADRAVEQRAILGRVREGHALKDFDTVRRRKDGTLVDVSLLVSPVTDGAGDVVGASGITRDLTAQRASEERLRLAEEQLRQAQKMEAIGSLAGGVAHDFNNLLSIILSYTYLALEDLPAGEPLRHDLEQVEKAGQRAADLTRQLLAFSRQQVLEPHAIDLNQCVHGVQRMLGRLLGEHIQLTLLLEQRPGSVFADPGQIEQVLMNLLVNARDAMPQGGSLTIETANVELDAAYAAAHHGVDPGHYVMLAVTDTGVGMDKATLSRIFEPFFTTKGVGKGTGLGLPTAYGIIKQSGGHVWVYSEPGEGTTFKVYFPRTDQPAEVNGGRGAAPTTLRGHETILLVEDADAVRATALTILRRQGYNVLEASNGGEALLICEQYAGRIDLLVTDVVMPRMNGRQLAERLAPLRPEMKVLFVSGYTEGTVIHHGMLDAGIAYLQKPLTPDTLARKVRELLDTVS